ncbi:MAG: hypothetical protein NWR96_06790 [Crocinitomicaceae bacterium]|jgi:hypothetical protein|nr:hypothetical protein [Crocinitomicaceae bacterium]
MKKTILLLTTCLIGIFSQAQTDQVPTIAVANPNVNGLTVKPESVAKMMRLEAIKLNKYKVYDEYDMADVLKAKEEYRSQCYGQNCLLKLGAELNVNYVMCGSVDGLGNKIALTIKIVDVKNQTLYKSSVKEFDNQETEIQRMIEILLYEMHGFTVDKVIADRLAFKNEVITSNNIGKINNSGPRIGGAALVGSLNEFATRSTSEGGLDIAPFVSMIGYQFEGQYVGTENFSALVEGIINVSGLEQGKFLPSFTLMNGFRFGKSGWEFAFGPRLSVKHTSNGFFDTDNLYSQNGKYFSESDWVKYAANNQVTLNEAYTFEENLDMRGSSKLSSSFVVGFGRTFREGSLNVPVNLFYTSQKGGGFAGINVGFNVQKSKQPINKPTPKKTYY